MQEFTAPVDGVYKLEVWGAQGAYRKVDYRGGKGGYSIGYKNFSVSNKLYICVGSKGSDNSGSSGGNGGYNGGGNGGDGYGNYSGGGGGGGATHIAIISNRGLLRNYKDYYELELLLVAGGGGGWGYSGRGSDGGGSNSARVTAEKGSYYIEGATQTSGYAFGQGQDGISKSYSASGGAEGNGGGGGGFYGGPASQREGQYSDCSGAGGSGYVGSVINGATIAGDQSFPSPSGGTEQGHLGNGYAIISWISPSL